MEAMTTTRRIDGWLTDMDGVLVHEDDPIPGASNVIEALTSSGPVVAALASAQ